MVNRTRVEGGGYSKHDIITWYDNRRVEITMYLEVDVYYIIILHTGSN